MQIEIKDIPLSRRGSSKYSELWSALISAPAGKAVMVPAGTFGTSAPQASLQALRRGRTLHARRMPDGIYLWLDAATNGEVK